MKKTLALSILVAACGGGTPPPQNVETQPSATTAKNVPPSSADAGVTAKVDPPAPLVEPDVRTDEQKKRDAALAPKAEAVVDAYSNVGGRLSPDKKKIFFRSNRDGNWHGYVGDIDKPNAAPKKLTEGTERIATFQITSDGKNLVWTSDTGADENYRIYKANPDGTGATTSRPARRSIEAIRSFRDFVRSKHSTAPATRNSRSASCTRSRCRAATKSSSTPTSFPAMSRMSRPMERALCSRASSRSPIKCCSRSISRTARRSVCSRPTDVSRRSRRPRTPRMERARTSEPMTERKERSSSTS